jgi:hypothetical protein
VGNLLSQLLSADEPHFSTTIKQLEQITSRPGIDTRLIAELLQKSQKVVKSLGLDPKDTTGEELFLALTVRIRSHEMHLKKHIKVSDTNPNVAIKQAIDNAKIHKTAWVLKKSVAKRLLQKYPPTRVMQLLGYTSIDSMLKRENLLALFACVRIVESSAWVSKFNKGYKLLTASDFETRAIEVILLDEPKFKPLQQIQKQPPHAVTHLKELGVVALLPSAMQQKPGYVITTLLVLLHYLNEIRLHSSYFKLLQVRASFGKLMVESLNNNELTAANLAGKQLHWRVVQRYFGIGDTTVHPDFFQPHMQPEDLYWHRVDEQLVLIDPELRFWKDLEYIGVMAQAKPVSFNVLDSCLMYYTETGYQQRTYRYMQEALWSELLMRYMNEKIVEGQVLSQLDSSMTRHDRLRF